MTLDGRRALVTGGSAGIGLRIAKDLMEAGARVAINGRDRDRLEQAGADTGAATVPGDVGEDAASVVDGAAEALGGLDILVNNAGIGGRATLEDLEPGLMERIWRTNVVGAAMCAKAALPHFRRAREESREAMKDGGRGPDAPVAHGGDIVNIASTAGLKGYPGGSAYCASKFALRGMTECWRAELRPDDVRVILINPSLVQTGWGGADESERQDPHLLFPDDIARAVTGALAMPDRALVTEVTVFANNPWEAEGA